MKSRLRSREIDMDPLSTSIVEDLMDSGSEWKGVGDIVKLTLKALTDVVRVQGASIKEINNTLPTRASKSELSTGLSLKANLQDVSRTFSEVSNALDTRITLSEMNDLIKDYISKEEFQDALVVKGYGNDSKSSSKILTTGPGEQRQDIQRQINKRMAGYVTLNQFQELLTIVEQKPSINQVNQILENKVSKPVFNAALQKLVPRSEFEVSLSKKSDLTDLQYIVSTLQSKADLSTIQKLTEIIQNKTDKSDSQLLFSKLQQIPQQTDIDLILQTIQEFRITIEKIGEDKEVPMKKVEYLQNQIGNLNTSLHSKISHTETSAIMTNLKYEVTEEIAKMKMHIRNHLNQDQSKSAELFSTKELLKEVSLWKREKEGFSKQIETLKEKLEDQGMRSESKELKEMEREFSEYKKKINQFKNTIILGLEEKLSTEELEQVLARWVEQIHIKMNDDKEDTLLTMRQIEQGVSLKMGEYSVQLQHLSSITKKQSAEEGAMEEALRRIRREADDVRKTVDKVYNQVQCKLNQAQYQSDLIDIKKKLQTLHKQLLLKSNIKDVCVLVDSKPNIEQINKALKQIHSQLSQKVSSQELKSVVQDQATINQTLCQQNIIGRWLWHSGQSKAGNLIPWETQTVNTLPHNFLWDKDQTSILTLASGLYEITVNVFSKFRVSVNVLVNGEVVSSRSGVEEREKENGVGKKKKGKELVSVQIHEFHMLPTRARVSVSFSGEPGCEGFLSIKRL